MAKNKGSPKIQSLTCLFGGVEPMARKLGHPRGTTIRSWIERDSIPNWRRKEIEELARREKVVLPKWFNGQ